MINLNNETDYKSLNSTNKFYILYIGAAKGTHLLYLANLFREFNFIKSVKA